MTKVLMSKDNPKGWKLEELLDHVITDLWEKTKRIENDACEVSQIVTAHNRGILKLLAQAKNLQDESMRALDAYKPDQGPLGVPRIGTEPQK
jgi:hypothetical protein